MTLQNSAERAVRVGSVNHATLTLKPGQRKTVKVRLKLPSDAGDTSRAITLASSDGHTTAVPVVQRAVVPITKDAGSFKGTITGGNARAGPAAQGFTYAFDVPKGTPDLGAGVTLADDAGIQLEGVLVDPNDETQSIGTNAYTNAAGTALTGQGRTMQLSTANPVPGRWRVIVLVVNPVTGKERGEVHRDAAVRPGSRRRGRGADVDEGDPAAGPADDGAGHRHQHGHRPGQRPARRPDRRGAQHAAHLALRAAGLPSCPSTRGRRSWCRPAPPASRQRPAAGRSRPWWT